MPRFNTKAVHVGQTPDEKTGAVIPPIYQTSTFAQSSPGKHQGYEYTRAGNPNFENLEKAIASLEEGKYATVFSSGLGAALAVLNLLQAGDHVIAGEDLYGGAYRLFMKWGARFGLAFTFVDGKDPKNFEKVIRPETKLIWMESPTNPLIQLTDIAAVSAIAKRKKILTVVDNTFASPFFQKPLLLGSVLSLHSTTKYIGGHSDVIGGAVVTNDQNLHEKLKFGRMALGVNPSPFDCWLAHRGLKTLGLRMERHEKNGLLVSNFLKSHPLVEKVYYPGLKSHPQYKLAQKQMSGFSGMLSATFRLKIDQTKKLISSFKFFTLAESLGGVESLVSHPATMTHASIPPEERERRGLKDGLVRFSVGIEDGEDLIQDLKEGLSRF